MSYDIITRRVPDGAPSREPYGTSLAVARQRARELAGIGPSRYAVVVKRGVPWREGDPIEPASGFASDGNGAVSAMTTDMIALWVTRVNTAARTASVDDDPAATRFGLLELDNVPPPPAATGGTTAPTTATTTVSHKERGRQVGPAESTTETVRLDTFAEPIANVKVALGRTVNTGNYSSARVDISITMPCRVADVEVAYNQALRFVEERIDAQIARVQRSESPAAQSIRRVVTSFGDLDDGGFGDLT